MEPAIASTPRAASRATKRAQTTQHLMSRSEAKDLLGEYAFTLVDEARHSDAALDAVLDRLDSEGVDTEAFEDAAFARMMDEGRTGKYVSLEQVMKTLSKPLSRSERKRLGDLHAIALIQEAHNGERASMDEVFEILRRK